MTNAAVSSRCSTENAYFADLALVPRFERDRELEMARAVVRTRRALWAVLLDPAHLPEVLAAVEGSVKDPELVAFVRSARVEGTACSDVASALDRIGDEHGAIEAVIRVAARRDPAWHAQAVRARKVFHAARDRFVRANLRLVVLFAGRNPHAGTSLADRIQDGNVGLMKAVDRFDPERGVRFSTYAVWWIRHAIARAQQEQGRTVRLPVHLQSLIGRIDRTRRSLLQDKGREPSTREIAATLDCDPDRVEWALRLADQRSVSIDAGLDATDTALVDMLSDEHALAEMDAVLERIDVAPVMAALAEMPARERDILEHRFHLQGPSAVTFEQLGARHGISRERTRQIQRDAVVQLRRTLVPGTSCSRVTPSAFLR